MGSSFSVECKECGYQKDYYLGIGMLYGCLFSDRNDAAMMNFLSELVDSKEIMRKVEHILSMQNGCLDVRNGHMMYECTQCRTLDKRFHFLVKADSHEYEPEYLCSHCLAPLKILDVENAAVRSSFNSKGFSCPECLRCTLVEDQSKIICWD